MKKFIARFIVIVALGWFVVFAIQDTIHDFTANHIVRYFREQPLFLLLVVAIGIAGGAVAFAFFRLSPRLQRRFKLLALGLAGSLVTLAGGYFSFWLAGLSPQLDSAIGGNHTFWIVLPCTIAVAGLLWFEFYQVFKKRVYNRDA
jgi:H+/Cl- antiporter ClcA